MMRTVTNEDPQYNISILRLLSLLVMTYNQSRGTQVHSKCYIHIRVTSLVRLGWIRFFLNFASVRNTGNHLCYYNILYTCVVIMQQKYTFKIMKVQYF